MRITPYLHFLALMLLPTTATAQIQVSGAIVLEHNVTANQRVVEGVLTLVNPDQSSHQASISLSDVRSDPKLGTVYLKAGTLPRSNTSWIELPSSVVTVPAKGMITVPYRINIPENAASGTHWGVLLVRPTASEGANPTQAVNGVSLRQVTEYAVQVMVHLPGGQSKLKFQSPSISKNDAGMMLSVEISNSGERITEPTTRAEVYDAQGQLIQKIDGRLRRILPGFSVAEVVELKNLKPGKYQILVMADDPKGEVVGARYNITVE